MSLGAQRAGRLVARTRMVLYLSLRAVARAMQTMSRAGPKSTSANLRALLASLCALYCVLPQPSWAGRPVRVYEVDVEGQSGPALQDAMRQALVRATGRRESADDPALASVVADATRYVKNYAVGPRGESQVVFDAAAVEQAITAAGRSIWDRERPFTLVVLIPPRNRAAEDAARADRGRQGAGRLRRDRAAAAERCGRAPRQHRRRRRQRRRLRCDGTWRRGRPGSGTGRLDTAGAHQRRRRSGRVPLPAPGMRRAPPCSLIRPCATCPT